MVGLRGAAPTASQHQLRTTSPAEAGEERVGNGLELRSNSHLPRMRQAFSSRLRRGGGLASRLGT